MFSNIYVSPGLRGSHWPDHLALPMMLMRENMRKSVLRESCSVFKKSPKPSDYGYGFSCPDCGRVYKLRSSLCNHQKWECGKEAKFKCFYCPYRAKQKIHMIRHIQRIHKIDNFPAIKIEHN